MDTSSSDSGVFRPDLNPLSILELAHNAGFSKQFVVIINSISGIIPRTYPIKLKSELAACVSKPKLIESLTYTKSNKIICSTPDFQTATELLSIKKLLSCQTQAEIITENLTSKFILHNVPVGISSKDISDELCSENDISVYEVRRFQRKVKGRLVPSETVLVTSMGDRIPDKIKLWYEIRRINLFIDRPRICLNCCEWTHNTKSCPKAKKCLRCGDNHDSSSCKNDLKCPNCNKAHEATSDECSIKQEEKTS